ncbi:hypothetical protein KDW63_12255 [Burkholderia cenocepacia]|uniref:hypothetical protein n=1 Tax=Burkholderia cenocepacia TaxID=95486 RepID=UPI001B953D03|nr:hypothetical protein [Burkholderia cenocepacia]MBR8294956.1 hypothetical protein [Burkholderia cenocepacia]
MPNGRWAFRLSAPAHNKETLAKIRKQAIERAEALNGNAIEPGTVEALVARYFEDGLPHTDERRKSQSTLDENRVESKRLVKVFGKMTPPRSSRSTSTATSTNVRSSARRRRRTRKSPSCRRSFNTAGAAASSKPTPAAESNTTRRGQGSGTCVRMRSI